MAALWPLTLCDVPLAPLGIHLLPGEIVLIHTSCLPRAPSTYLSRVGDGNRGALDPERTPPPYPSDPPPRDV